MCPVSFPDLNAIPMSEQDVEKELEVQIGMKQEMELSMKMLEKDVCEKQDALVELRQQLEDFRAINQQLTHKSQVNVISLRHRPIKRLCVFIYFLLVFLFLKNQFS